MNPDPLPQREITLDPVIEQPTITSPKLDDPLVGSILGSHLKILSRVGAGGMSVVYKAEDLLLNRIVAVKVLHSHSALNPKNILRFRREAMAASKIDHPNVIRIYEFNVPEDGQPYLVMDYIEGESLADFIKTNGPIEVRRAITLMGTICDGLQCAHDAGVIHRDLKPGNIMLLKDSKGKQTLKVVDFGIAKLLTDSEDGHALTQTGEVFGSPLYMSPEQCWGKELDRRSDIYSLGCVMYEMCTGHPPIKGSSMLETIHLQTAEMPSPVNSIHPGIKYSAELDAVLLKAMAKDPALRFQAPAEFKHALNRALDGVIEESSSRATAKTPQKYMIAACLAAIVLVAGSACIVWNQSRTTAVQQLVQPHQPLSAEPRAGDVNTAETDQYRRMRANTVKYLSKVKQSAKRLELNNKRLYVTDEELPAIANMRKLKDLNLTETQITDKSGPVVASLPALETLRLHNTQVGDAFLEDISILPLRYLNCQGTQITDAALDSIAKMKRLYFLSLSVTGIGDSGLKKISHLRLTELKLTDTNVTSAGIKHLEQMQSLNSLIMGRNGSDNECVQSLSKLTNLKQLGLEGIPITDSGVKALLTLRKLETLNLSESRITDASMITLARFPMLKTLRLHGCNISSQALEKFKSSSSHAVDIQN